MIQLLFRQISRLGVFWDFDPPDEPLRREPDKERLRHPLSGLVAIGHYPDASERADRIQDERDLLVRTF